jgi:hypothetical protein
MNEILLITVMMAGRVYLNLTECFLTSVTNILFIVWGLDIQMEYSLTVRVHNVTFLLCVLV